MCASMVTIQSATAEIKRGKKEEEDRNHRANIIIMSASMLRRSAITNSCMILGHVANARPVARIKTGRVAQPITDVGPYSDATGLNCGDRSWICHAPLVL